MHIHLPVLLKSGARPQDVAVKHELVPVSVRSSPVLIPSVCVVPVPLSNHLLAVIHMHMTIACVTVNNCDDCQNIARCRFTDNEHARVHVWSDVERLTSLLQRGNGVPTCTYVRAVILSLILFCYCHGMSSGSLVVCSTLLGCPPR